MDTTDVATGWNECAALMGRGEVGLVKALEAVRERLPFKLLGIDFDSGGEFVNWHLVRYCKRNKLTYTRARESYSNDQPYIEQRLKEKTRNGAHVTRRYAKAKTAYQRVMESPDISTEVKEMLKERFLELNPRRLLLEIIALARKANS